MKRDFKAELAAADQAYRRAGYPADVNRRVRARIRRSGETRDRAWVAWMGLTVGAALSIMWILAQPKPLTTTRIAEFVVEDQTDDLDAVTSDDGTVEVRRGGATMIDYRRRIDLQMSAPAKIQTTKDSLRVIEGEVGFGISPRTAPLIIAAHPVEIRTVGAHFWIDQSAEGGRITVRDGRVEVREADRVGRVVLAGGTTRWPTPPPPKVEPPAIPSTPKVEPRIAPPVPVVKPTPFVIIDDRAERIFARLTALRSNGAYDEAATLLEDALQDDLDPTVAVRFSYELGVILTDRFVEHKRACRHWEAHQKRFGAASYRNEIERAMKACREGETR